MPDGVVLGGICAGIMTPTEAAAVGAFGALLMADAARGASPLHPRVGTPSSRTAPNSCSPA